jgi:hypothetical protein
MKLYICILAALGTIAMAAPVAVQQGTIETLKARQDQCFQGKSVTCIINCE